MENRKTKNEKNQKEEIELKEEAAVSTGENTPLDNEETKSKEKRTASLEKENECLRKELDEQKEKYLRLFAEYDNYRKRTNKETSEAYSRATAEAVTSFLPLLDNLERAQQYAPDDEGMRALIKQLQDILVSLKVTVIDSDNKCFDPNFHNAIMHEEDESTEECRIVQTFQKGYMLGDKVIRHAMVKVVN